MRRAPPFLACVGAVVGTFVAALLPAAAHAYVRTRSQDGTHNMIWPNPNITMTVRTGGTTAVPPEDFVGATARAAQTWSDPTLISSVAFTVRRSQEAPIESTFDHQNLISFRADSWPDRSLGALALTTVWTQGGRIVDADTEINAHDPTIVWGLLPDDPAVAALSPEVDLQNALTHELGHVLGLDHPCYLVDPPDPPEVTNEGEPVPACSDPALPESVRDATMYPSATTGSIDERTLSADEVLALHDLYPAGRAPLVDGAPPPESSGCVVAGQPTVPSGTAVVVAALFAAALLLSRRRRAGA